MKSTVTYRVQSPNWISDEHFEKNFDQLKRYKDKFEEVALFTGYTHSPLTVETTREMCEKAKERIPILKEMGFKVGFNWQVTLGHNNENQKYSLQGDYERSVGADGKTTNGCLCPRGKKVKEYIRECVALLAETNPDFIWIDDDLRMMWHGNGYPDYDCFCPNCLKEFGEKINVQNMDIDKFNELTCGENPDKMIYRKAWAEFCRDSLGGIMELCREECDKINPNIVLGYMHADTICGNSDFAYFGKKLAGKNNLPVKWRPGGGFYTDFDKNGFITKALYLGRQISNIPKEYTDIQSELENFPYHQLHKSAYANVLESVLYIGAGCTGVTYNCHHQESWGSEWRTVEENEPRFSQVLPYRDFFDECVKTFERESNKGVFCDKDVMSYYSKNFEEGNWLYGEHREMPVEMYNIGFSPAFKKENCQVFYAFDETFASLSDDEILDVLSKGVYINGRALIYLTKRGFGKYLGFKVADIFATDCHELFLENEFNKDFKGYRRECRYAFYGGTFYGIVKTDENAEYLGKFNDFGSNEFVTNGETLYSMGVFENSLGGRICVSGYNPDIYISCLPKTTQLKRVFRWLSFDSMAYVESYHNVNYFDRGVGGLIFNNSFDVAENVVLALPKEIDEVVLVKSNMNKIKIKALSFDGKYSRFDLGKIKAFGFVLVKY